MKSLIILAGAGPKTCRVYPFLILCLRVHRTLERQALLGPANRAPSTQSDARRLGSRMAVLVLLAGLAFAVKPASAAVTEAWVQRYNNVLSNANDEAFKVV